MLPIARLALLMLLTCIAGGCSRGNNSPSQATASRQPVPWAGMSPDERDRTAVAALIESDKFSGPRCRWLKYGAWVQAWPQELLLYQAAHDAGFIEMEQTGTYNRIGTPEPVWRIAITDAGRAVIAGCKVSSGRNDWGVPVSRRRFISAKYVGEGKHYSGLTIFEVEYQWTPTEVGERVKAGLTGTMKVEEGKYRSQVWLRKVPNGWYVDSVDVPAVLIE